VSRTSVAVALDPFAVILERLHSARRSGTGYAAHCPAHDDQRASLSLDRGTEGGVVLHCHAGCSPEAVVKALGLEVRDLMPLSPPAGRRVTRSGRSAAASGNRNHGATYATACDAVSALERQHGPSSAKWTYTDQQGTPVGLVLRWNGPSGKTIRPVSRRESGWIVGGMSAPRPLYRLAELATSPRVYICEGEKAADAVNALGLVATTSAHGSNAAEQTDWSPLAGRLCTILPDNDPAGRRYATNVARMLARLAPAPTVKIVELPDLPAAGDAVEYIASRRAAGLEQAQIRSELERMAETAEPVELKPAEPVIERYQPFPVEVLPEPVRSFVSQGAKAIGCDASYIALPLLSALASAIGNTRRIELKRGWVEPPIVWTAIVGESGTLKTPAYKLVTRPIHERQNEMLKRHAERQVEYQAEALRFEKALMAWKRDKASGDDPPVRPEPPQAVRYIVSDTTVEALAPILAANPRGVLLARDEVAGWIGSFDRYAQARGADAAHWLSMHNGESMVVDRKTGHLRTIYVASASVSVTGGIQPGILDRILGLEHRESGLLARLLLAMPPRRKKRWTEAEIPARVEAAICALFDRLYALDFDRDSDGNARPRLVSLSPGGKRAWIEFYDAHAAEYDELTGDLSAAWSKLEGYAARLALVVHFVRWGAGDPELQDPDAVDEASVVTGVALSRWFGREARRVYGILDESDEERDRRRLLELIERKGGSVTIRGLLRSSRMFATASEAEMALDVLVQAGKGRWESPEPGSHGGRPTRRFVLTDPCEVGRTMRENRADTVDVDKTPNGGTGNGGFVNVNAVNAARSFRFAGDQLDFGDVCAGWTPAGWAAELRRKADRCDQYRPDVAERFRAWAADIEARLGRTPVVRRDRSEGV